MVAVLSGPVVGHALHTWVLIGSGAVRPLLLGPGLLPGVNRRARGRGGVARPWKVQAAESEKLSAYLRPRPWGSSSGRGWGSCSSGFRKGEAEGSQKWGLVVAAQPWLMVAEAGGLEGTGTCRHLRKSRPRQGCPKEAAGGEPTPGSHSGSAEESRLGPLSAGPAGGSGDTVGADGRLALREAGTTHPLPPDRSCDVSQATASIWPVYQALRTPTDASAWLRAGLPAWHTPAGRCGPAEPAAWLRQRAELWGGGGPAFRAVLTWRAGTAGAPRAGALLSRHAAREAAAAAANTRRPRPASPTRPFRFPGLSRSCPPASAPVPPIRAVLTPFARWPAGRTGPPKIQGGGGGLRPPQLVPGRDVARGLAGLKPCLGAGSDWEPRPGSRGHWRLREVGLAPPEGARNPHPPGSESTRSRDLCSLVAEGGGSEGPLTARPHMSHAGPGTREGVALAHHAHASTALRTEPGRARSGPLAAGSRTPAPHLLLCPRGPLLAETVFGLRKHEFGSYGTCLRRAGIRHDQK
uniref:collagen alpha-1(I) chain-like n=1 Tax=Panthera onca TaxID=9690 RepID=UPI002955DF23|nr:collagen alpha-1(I) chain-like [Panthera onca]